MTPNDDIWEEFRNYFEKLFPREPSLRLSQFKHLDDFPHLKVTEVDSCEGHPCLFLC